MEECLHKIYPILEEFASQTRLGNTVAVQEKEARKRRNVEKSYHAGSEMITSKKPRCRRHKQTDSISNGIHFSDEDEDKLEEHREDDESGDE